MKLFGVVVWLLMACCAKPAFGAEFPIQGRVFVGGANGSLSEVNKELKTLGLEEFGTIPMFGAEITYSVLPVIEVGINYVKKQNIRKASSPGAQENYKAELDQDVFLAIVRIPIVKNKFTRLDAFAGIGGSVTTLKIDSATEKGELTRRDDKEFVASLASRYGASVAFGYKGIYLVLEGGYEANNVDSLKRTGTLSENIRSIDMSGPYGMIGLHFDAPEITKR